MLKEGDDYYKSHREMTNKLLYKRTKTEGLRHTRAKSAICLGDESKLMEAKTAKTDLTKTKTKWSQTGESGKEKRC